MSMNFNVNKKVQCVRFSSIYWHGSTLQKNVNVTSCFLVWHLIPCLFLDELWCHDGLKEKKKKKSRSILQATVQTWRCNMVAFLHVSLLFMSIKRLVFVNESWSYLLVVTLAKNTFIFGSILCQLIPLTSVPSERECRYRYCTMPVGPVSAFYTI